MLLEPLVGARRLTNCVICVIEVEPDRHRLRDGGWRNRENNKGVRDISSIRNILVEIAF